MVRVYYNCSSKRTVQVLGNKVTMKLLRPAQHAQIFVPMARIGIQAYDLWLPCKDC